MFKKLILLNYFFLLCFVFSSQSLSQTKWTKTYGGANGDVGRSIQQTTDGGYIIIGSTMSFGQGNSDVWLIKADEFGDTLWTKTYGGIDSESGISIQQTTDGGYIIIGNTKSFGQGSIDVWIIKTNEFGDSLWTRTYGGLEADRGYSGQQTADGGYIIIGITHSFGAGDGDIWLNKTNEFGDSLCTRTYGGSYLDRGYSGQQTTDGGYIITGNTRTFAVIPPDIWLIKTDAFGDTIWTKTYCDSVQGYGCSVQQTSDSGYIITGNIEYMGNSDICLIKTNEFGDTLWTKTFFSSSSDKGYSVQQTNDGGYIITGIKGKLGVDQSDVYLIKTDELGDTLWTKTYGGSYMDQGECVKQTTDFGYIITGYTFSFGAGSLDAWAIKTDSLGNTTLPTFIQENVEQAVYKFHTFNYPNPFNPITTIEFTLPKTEFVTLIIYNLLGQKVATLVSEELNSGSYKVDWNAGSFSSGIYIYRLETDNGFVQSRKLILLK